MVAKTGLVVPSNRDESKDRWKSDRPGTQILYIRGFTQTELMRIFFVFIFGYLQFKDVHRLSNYHIYDSVGNNNKLPD